MPRTSQQATSSVGLPVREPRPGRQSDYTAEPGGQERIVTNQHLVLQRKPEMSLSSLTGDFSFLAAWKHSSIAYLARQFAG